MLSTDSQPEVKLESILKKSQDKSWNALLPDELNILTTAFSPSESGSFRSKAYIVLSIFCQRLRETSSKPEAATDAIIRIFLPPTKSKLGETAEREVLHGLTFLAALFQVDWQAASVIFAEDGVVDSVVDSTDIFPDNKDILLAVAQLLSQAAGHKASRAVIPSQCIEWLQAKSRRSDDSPTRGAAAVALVKLSRGAESDASIVTGPDSSSPSSNDDELAKLMKGLVIDGPNSDSLADAVEGLAYLSMNPKIKEQLSVDSSFLAQLFSMVPRRKPSVTLDSDADDIRMSPVYGTVLIISNLCTYRPHLSQEDAQIAKLRQMAKASGKDQAEEDPELAKLEDDEHVQGRCRRLIKAGVLEALAAAVRTTDSKAVRLLVGKSFLSLVEDKENRGKVLQAGGAKALMTIIQRNLPSPSKESDKLPSLDAAEIEPIQAVAKLAITASPVQVFGPNAGALYDAIRPFTLMLVHPSSNLLQQFEAIMALTNLSSSSPEAADRIAKAEGLMNKVELLMLENHTLIRRASMELICNLIAGSDEVFNRYGGHKDAGAKSKLQVLVALCDVDDLPTRLASSGALATLTASKEACQCLFELHRERHRVLPILAQLVDPTITPLPDGSVEEVVEEIRSPTQGDSGLVHRGVVSIRNLLVGIEDKAARKELAEEAQQLGLVQALARVFKDYSTTDRSSPVLRPTAEALKVIMESGVPIVAG